MAETKMQNRPSETEPSLVRPDYYPDMFRTNPFAMMRHLSEEMDRIFSSTFGITHDGGAMRTWSPAIEIREQNGNLEVTAELPGMTKDDVKVEYTDEGIILQGEKKQEREENRHGFHRSERSYGSFYRVIPLPQGAQTEKAKAEFKNGILQVRIPVPESKQTQRHQIPITQ